ncbi:MAG TPA: hypothetical protein VKD71_00440 [Gemmataceae bacterium]|nr:hypothetical protein [Gemmataceae bacterium]
MPRIGFAVFAVFLAQPAFACSIPVFRYALEQWPPSHYALVVYHNGPINKEERAAVQKISDAARRANVRVTTIDLKGDVDPEQKAVWDREGKDAKTPRVLLRYPESGPEIPSLLSCPLVVEPIVALLDSPARRAIFDRLTLGNAAAIVLLLCGDQKADDAARAMLGRELPAIARGMDLPPRTPDGPQVQSELPLRVAFPVVEVARDSKEDLLVRLLVKSEDGLDRVRGPIVFPVFGRGRALCSLHGRDLEKPDELRRSLEYLCRACSCQVKELNPGVDLLMTGNWERIFDAEKGPPPQVVAETRGSASVGPGVSELRSRPPDGYSPVETLGDSETSTRRPWVRYGVIATAVTIIGYCIIRGRRSNPPERH